MPPRTVCVATRVFRTGAAAEDDDALDALANKLETFLRTVKEYATAADHTKGDAAAECEAGTLLQHALAIMCTNMCTGRSTQCQ